MKYYSKCACFYVKLDIAVKADNGKIVTPDVSENAIKPILAESFMFNHTVYYRVLFAGNRKLFD